MLFTPERRVKPMTVTTNHLNSCLPPSFSPLIICITLPATVMMHTIFSRILIKEKTNPLKVLKLSAFITSLFGVTLPKKESTAKPITRPIVQTPNLLSDSLSPDMIAQPSIIKENPALKKMMTFVKKIKFDWKSLTSWKKLP